MNFVSQQSLHRLRVNLGELRSALERDHFHFARALFTPGPRRRLEQTTKRRLVSIVMRTVFAFSKRVSNRCPAPVSVVHSVLVSLSGLSSGPPPQRERILLEERVLCLITTQRNS